MSEGNNYTNVGKIFENVSEVENISMHKSFLVSRLVYLYDFVHF